MMRRVARGIIARAVTVATAATAAALPAVSASARFASAAPKAPAAGTVATPAVKVNAAAKPGKATDAFAAKLGSRVVSRHQAGDHASVIIDSQMFAWVVMDRAGSSANALGDEFGASLMAAMNKAAELVQAKQARVIILTSAKDTFCVGADIDQLYPAVDQSYAVRVSQEGQQMLQQLADLKIPVVAAINGLALGGGCELALACHHRVMASTAQMGLPECLLGLLPGAGGTVRLPQLIGLQNALGWILKSSSNRAETCKKQGAVDAVVQSEDRFVGENRFIEGVRAWAGKLVDKPLRPAKGKKKSLMNKFIEDTSIGHKLVVWQSLKALNKQTKGKFLGHYAALESTIHAAKVGATADAYAFEAKKFGEMLVTPEAKNQIALYYLENLTKNIEKKTGLPKKSVWDVKNVGVIGAGVMGSGIAQLFVNKKYNVALKDVDQARVDAGVQFIQGEFDKVIKRKRATAEDVKKKMSLLRPGTDDSVFNETDVIIEAAVEIMDIKKKIVQGLEDKKVLDGKKIFATNTSSLSVTDLQSVSKFPDKVVGMHFFNPVAKMPLVEVIVGDKTSKETAAAIYNLALKTGKKPIIVKDAPGFVVNRVLGVYMAEAGRLVEDGADPIKVEQAILNFGLPMGPFGLLDMVGLDVACHVGPVLEKGLKSKRFSTHPKIREMMEQGYLGKKVRKGFYRYDEKGKELGIDATVVAKYLTTSPDSTFPAADIVDRCILLMVNEAAMILGEGVAATPEDVDTGMVWGTGFAPFRGGLLQYADHRGIQAIVDRLTQLQNKHKDDRFAPAPLLKEMVAKKTRFFPNRPFVPYVERVGFPTVSV